MFGHCDRDAPPSRSRARSLPSHGSSASAGPARRRRSHPPTLTDHPAAQENPRRSGPRGHRDRAQPAIRDEWSPPRSCSSGWLRLAARRSPTGSIRTPQRIRAPSRRGPTRCCGRHSRAWRALRLVARRPGRPGAHRRSQPDRVVGRDAAEIRLRRSRDVRPALSRARQRRRSPAACRLQRTRPVPIQQAHDRGLEIAFQTAVLQRLPPGGGGKAGTGEGKWPRSPRGARVPRQMFPLSSPPGQRTRSSRHEEARIPRSAAESGPMELRGLEPLTSWVRSRRSPN